MNVKAVLTAEYATCFEYLMPDVDSQSSLVSLPSSARRSVEMGVPPGY